MSQLKYFTAATGSPFTPSAVSGTTITVSSTTNLLAGMSVENATAGINTTISSITNSTQFVVASATGITTSTALNIGTWVTATVGAQGAQGSQGSQGTQGNQGVAYLVTSTTSQTITSSSSSMSFTVAAGLGYTAGQTVHIAYTTTPANYMIGVVTSYSSTTLTVAIVGSAGSGTYAAWTINVSGGNGAWSGSGDSNLAFSSATNSGATVTVSGGYTNYLVCYNGFEGSTAASANGNVYNLGYTTNSGATITSGGGNQAFAYSPGSTTNRPSWGNVRVITMSGTGSFVLQPQFSSTGSGTGYANSTYVTVVGLS